MVGTADPHWPRGISYHTKHKLFFRSCPLPQVLAGHQFASGGFYITCFLPPPYETVFFLTQEVFFLVFAFPIRFHIPLWE